MIRVIAGFILAPLLGPLIFYLLLSIQSLFSLNISGISFSKNPLFFLGVIAMVGPLFYLPAVVFGVVVMLLIRHFYSWNIFTCVIGALISAFLVASLFFLLLLFIGSGFIVSKAGFLRLLAMIFIPSVFAGMFFWLIAVYRNGFLDYLPKSKPK